MNFLGLNHFVRCWTTKQHQNWWKNRKVDWMKEYVSTWNHPHRQFISEILTQLPWQSIYEMGCGPGPNLVQIIKKFPQNMVGGSDINADAIKVAKSILQGAPLDVCPHDNIMASDKFTDLVLTDRTLMYVSFFKIKKVIKEMKRVCRTGVIIVEYHTDSWWEKVLLFLSSGMYAHNYGKLLRKEGFYDMVKVNMPILKDSDRAQRKLLKLIFAKQ